MVKLENFFFLIFFIFFLLYIWCRRLKRHHSTTFQTYILSAFRHMFLHTSGGSKQHEVQLVSVPRSSHSNNVWEIRVAIDGGIKADKAAADTPTEWGSYWLASSGRSRRSQQQSHPTTHSWKDSMTHETWPVQQQWGSWQNVPDKRVGMPTEWRQESLSDICSRWLCDAVTRGQAETVEQLIKLTHCLVTLHDGHHPILHFSRASYSTLSTWTETLDWLHTLP